MMERDGRLEDGLQEDADAQQQIEMSKQDKLPRPNCYDKKFSYLGICRHMSAYVGIQKRCD